MTRRTHACIGCADAPGTTPFNKPGRTRHKDGVCAICRTRGVYVRGGVLYVPIEIINYRGRAA